MEHLKVLKFLKIMAYIFISLTLVEITFVILMNFSVFDISGSSTLLAEFIYGSNLISLTGTILWLFLTISVICFLIIGIFLFSIGNKNKIESTSLAKFIMIIGMVILIGALVKMNYLVLLGKTKIATTPTSIRLQAALYDFNITTIIPAIFWTYFISANCAYIILGIVIAVIGIKWNLLIEQPESKKE